jgi:hypothetical protein
MSKFRESSAKGCLATPSVARNAQLTGTSAYCRGSNCNLGSLPAPANITSQIVQYLKARPGGAGVGQLREDLGLSAADKPAFDKAVLSLYRQRRVYLDRHDYPQGLSAVERDGLVPDGLGTYFVLICLREPDELGGINLVERSPEQRGAVRA